MLAYCNDVVNGKVAGYAQVSAQNPGANLGHQAQKFSSSITSFT